MDPSPSFLKVFAAIAALFLVFSTGLGRQLIRSSNAVDSFATDSLLQKNGGKSREMIELDYEDAGPNTNTRSGFMLPLPGAPAPL